MRNVTALHPTTQANERHTARGFDPKNVRVLGQITEAEEIWQYTGEFRGRTYVHIRKVWLDKNGEWNPGKGGFTVEERDAGPLIAALKGGSVRLPCG